MSRAHLIRSQTDRYHVTARTREQLFFPRSLSIVWQIFLEELASLEGTCELRIHSFVLMSNHFHLLLQTPQGNLDKAMHELMRRSALRISGPETGALWGGRYKWSLIRTRAHYYQVYRYIYQNPLRAGLVGRVEDYPFSSLNHRMPFLLHGRLAIELASKSAELNWLNERGSFEQEEVIRKGLKHAEFDVNRKKLRLFESLKEPQKKS
jgi:putative transposase